MNAHRSTLVLRRCVDNPFRCFCRVKPRLYFVPTFFAVRYQRFSLTALRDRAPQGSTEGERRREVLC